MTARKNSAAAAKRLIAGAIALATFATVPLQTRAAIETDPATLYATMRQAFDQGAKRGWTFSDNSYYLSTVLDAGRAYSLFNPTDPSYATVAALAVDVCTQLHYNPLTNNDAAEWYVREAATYEMTHGDPPHVANANALLTRLNAADTDVKILAQEAETDAQSNSSTFPTDADAGVQAIVADVRAYNLTHDDSYRSLMLAHAAQPSTPLVRIPDPELPQLFAVVRQAIATNADASFTDVDRKNAQAIDYRRLHTAELRVISRSVAIPHDVRLTRTAPADEYFGRLKMSPLGVRNELIRINKYLDVGWGTRMTHDALFLEDTIVDWQHQYPRDTTLPQHLFDCYTLLKRVDSTDSDAEAVKIRTLLLVQYAGTPQAQLLATS